MTADDQQCSVLVVGAGIAGLAAAHELAKHLPNVMVVEASDSAGGRIRQISGLFPTPIELGPHFIHGSKTILGDLIMEAGCKYREYQWPDRWFFSKGKHMLGNGDHDADIAAVMDKFDSVGDQSFPAKDLSAESWLRQHGANERMIDIAEACYANDFGCSLKQMGMRETILENQKWDSGEEYLVLDRPLSALTDHLQAKSGVPVLTSWPVVSLDYSSNSIIVRSAHGRTIHCQHVIVTVPLKILQRQSIQFSPALPKWKQKAIERVQMSNAIKVIIVLDRQIWPNNFFDVVCPDGFIPEYWIVEDLSQQAEQVFAIVGFVAGLKAESMSHMNESAVISKAIAQLDEIFGKGSRDSQDRYPATNAFVKAHVADWSKEPYISGAYSYPSLGAEIGDRDRLAAPLMDRLFFAGEATHPAVNPCLQAAYETGISAAERVLKVARGRSRL